MGLAACSTIGKAPIDDAYYWPEKSNVSTQPSQHSQPRPSSSTPAVSPIEYTNVQDTAVTIRIHK